MSGGFVVSDAAAEVQNLLKAGKSPAEVRRALEDKGFSTEDIASALDSTGGNSTREQEDKRSSRILATREVFDRIGYGSATPQFVNILFWLSQQSNPWIMFIIGMLNGLKTILSVVWSSVLQEYNRVHRFTKNGIAAAGIVFGFCFLFMAFGLLIRSTWLFGAAFLLGTFGVVAYGDLYQNFVREIIRKERMGSFLRSIAHWGVLITAVSLLLTGWLLDTFPMAGTPWSFALFGKTYSLRVYGYLLAFEITAFMFILSGYMTSFLHDPQGRQKAPFFTFLRQHVSIVRAKLGVIAKDANVALLATASLISGLLQILLTSYSGIAIYKLLSHQSSMPFVTLGIIYAIAILTSFLGPFFTEQIHRSTGLTPTLVFGTLLTAILPLALVYNATVAAITLALCLNVIGGAISGFAQGLIAQKLLPEETRREYFQAQSFLLILPYIILIPILSWLASVWSLERIFIIVAIGLVAVVMPLYFILVVRSQHQKL